MMTTLSWRAASDAVHTACRELSEAFAEAECSRAYKMARKITRAKAFVRYCQASTAADYVQSWRRGKVQS